jgi:hypothetical protein
MPPTRARGTETRVNKNNRHFHRYMAYLRHDQIAALQAIERRHGAKIAAQVRRAIDWWLRWAPHERWTR